MKKLVLVVLLIGLVCVFGKYPSHPLKGKLRLVTVTKREAGESGVAERVITIQDSHQIQAIEGSLEHVWQSFLGANSLEGFPRYRMVVVYTDGQSEVFVFTRAEWGMSGSTPP